VNDEEQQPASPYPLLCTVTDALTTAAAEIELGTGQGAMMLCGWEGNHRPGGK